MDFRKIFFIVAITLSIALSFFGIIYITQPTNAAISPISERSEETRFSPIYRGGVLTLPQERIETEGKENELWVMSYESSIGGMGEETHPYPHNALADPLLTTHPHNPIHYLPSSYPSKDNEQIDLFNLYLFKEYFVQEKVDFKLSIFKSFALVSNFPRSKKQGKENNLLLNFDQNALVGLRYTHQGTTIWDTKVKVVTGLAKPNGGYGFNLSLTKNF